MSKDELIGTYKLISWENRHESGEISYPLGPDAKGLISYSQDGFVFVHIMAVNRKAFSSGDLFGGEASEIVAGATSHISYCGTYKIENQDVIHRVQICSFPNWVSTEQRRHFHFDNGNLLLSAEGLKIKSERVGVYLIWQPLGPNKVL
jgi:hypothetical protein